MKTSVQMLIKEISGNIARKSLENLKVDLVEIEWYEANKRILRKISNDGTDLAIKFLKEGQGLHDGDILYRDQQKAIVVHIKPCLTIVINPGTKQEMGKICYEIGNKHMALFIEGDLLLMPFETPIYQWLQACGYEPLKEQHQLLNLLQSNVAPHKHSGNTSLFSKIITIASNLSKDDE